MLALACLVDKSTHARGAHFWKSYFRMEYNQRRIVEWYKKNADATPHKCATRSASCVECRNGDVQRRPCRPATTRRPTRDIVRRCGVAVMAGLGYIPAPFSAAAVAASRCFGLLCGLCAIDQYVYIYIKCKRQPNCISRCVVVAWRRGAAQADSCICAAILNATARKI